MHPAKVLKDEGFAALKQYGQNFLLHDASLRGLEKRLSKDESILEIGAGLGQISKYLEGLGYHVILLEKDRGLAGYLKRQFSSEQVVCADFLELDAATIEGWGVTTVVSNLPFYITSPIILRVARELLFVEKAVWGMQREVAERIGAQKGGSLSILLNALGEARIIANMPAHHFYPRPKVDARWVYWERCSFEHNLELFELLLGGAFWGKRKKLRGSFKKNPFWPKSNLAAQLYKALDDAPEDVLQLLEKRADHLDVDQYLRILNWLEEFLSYQRK